MIFTEGENAVKSRLAPIRQPLEADSGTVNGNEEWPQNLSLEVLFPFFQSED